MKTSEKDFTGNKPYFPFLLGNGIDAVLVDYSGSMGCNSEHIHMEQHQGAVCAWYKGTQRNYQKPIYPILQNTYSLLAAGGEPFEVGSFSQSFDTARSVLTTGVRATDFKVNIETFLTSEQVLVERYHIVELPEGEVSIGLNLHPPHGTANVRIPLPVKTCYEFSGGSREGQVVCSYKIAGTKGTAIMYTDSPQVTEHGFHEGRRLAVTGLREGAFFTRYLLVLDEIDAPDHEREIIKRLNRVIERGYAAVLDEHRNRWRQCLGSSSVSLPDKNLEYLYHLSLYFINSNQNPCTGSLSVGNYPVLWGGGVTAPTDVLYMIKALLAANMTRQGEQTISAYEKAWPTARSYAKAIRSKGAYFPWFMNYKGVSLNFSHPGQFPKFEKFNNAWIVMEIWDYYLYTGDIRVLKKFFGLIEDIAGFLCSELVEEKAGIVELREIGGYEDHLPRKNDTSHLLPLIKVLEILIQAGGILAREIPAAYPRLLKNLKLNLRRNYESGVLLKYPGAGIITTEIFEYYLVEPKTISKEAIEKTLERCEGTLGLTNPGAYQNLIWPWAEFKAAYILSRFREKRRKAFFHLLRGSRYASSLGAFPEKIRPDGFPIGYWFGTCHASYVMALTSILVHSQDDIVRVLPGIPASWENLQFRNLRVPPGILVSLKLKNKRVEFLRLRNETPGSVRIKLEIPSVYLVDSQLRTEGFINLKPKGVHRL